MNAIISLCHFCELHGPSVLFSTQSFHDLDPSSSEQRNFYGSTDLLDLRRPSVNPSVTCEACQSFRTHHVGFICNDHEGRISYLSTQHPLQQDVANLVKQACFRSLSCEVSPGKEGPIFFGDNSRGHVLSQTFFLKDAQARGFQRWFSIIVLMRDKLFLLNSHSFLVDNIRIIIGELQKKVSKVYDAEQGECPQRSLRLSAPDNLYKQTNKQTRSVIELTADKLVFPQLHLWFTWLLRVGANRMFEKLSQGLLALDIDWHQQQETEEGFTIVSPNRADSSICDLEASLSSTGDDSKCGPCIVNIRHLHQVLDTDSFLSLAYGLMIGLQIVVRGNPQKLVSSIINCFKVLVPRSCFKAILQSNEYLDASYCNVLGLSHRVAVPQCRPDVLRLDILPPQLVTDVCREGEYVYKLTWEGKLPAKCPTILQKMQKAIENTKLTDGVLHYHFIALKEEWLNISKVIQRIQNQHASSNDVAKLFQSLGAQDQDRQLIDFWSKGKVIQPVS